MPAAEEADDLRPLKTREFSTCISDMENTRNKHPESFSITLGMRPYIDLLQEELPFKGEHVLENAELRRAQRDDGGGF